MPAQKQRRPPLLITRQPMRSALEGFFFNPVPTSSEPDPTLYDILTNVTPSQDYNAYIFTQYLCATYVGIFTNWATSVVYEDIINGIRAEINATISDGKVKDRSLIALIQSYPIVQKQDTMMLQMTKSQDFVLALAALCARIQPEKVYPGIDELLRVILTIFDSRPVTTPKVMMYQILLRPVEGYDYPTLTLAPLMQMTLDTTQFTGVKELYWKFVFSLNIPTSITKPGDLSDFLYVLAMLALPIDPVSLNSSIYFNALDNAKALIPFGNYLAMYLKQRDLGFDYTMSRLANSRRILMRSLHRFCGVGSVGVSDINFARYLFRAIPEICEEPDRRGCMSDGEGQLFRDLSRTIDGGNQLDTVFDRRLSYEGANEALDPTAVKKKTAKKGSKDDPKKKPGDTPPDPDPNEDPPDPDQDPDEDPSNAFGDDPKNLVDDDTTLGNLDSNSNPDSSQTNDDNIDQGGGLKPKVQAQSRLLPLALPSETIDDHVYRLGVLQFVTTIDQNSNLDIPPETLMELRAWCKSWLWLVAISVTKKLMAQLKVASHLKEFVA